MKRTLAAMTATFVLAGLAGCGSDEALETTPPSTSSSSTPTSDEPSQESAGPTVDVTIADGAVDPQGARVDAKVGDEITLSVTSDAADELHVHSDPEHTFDVAPGDDGKVFTFTVENPGQIAVELHDLGVTVVQLVVTP